MTWRCFAFRGLALIAAALPFAGHARGEEAIVVYASEFASGKADHWSNQRIGAFNRPSQSVAFRRLFDAKKPDFLGLFRMEAVKLTLDDLPPHARIRISFDFLAIDEWGFSSTNVFDLTVDGGPRLLRSSFSNVAGRPQSYPAPHGLSSTNHQTGSTIAKNSNAIYRIERTFAHSGESVDFVFTCQAASGMHVKAGWGLGRVKVEALPAVPNVAIDAKAVAAAWETLRQEDTLEAAEASNVLIEAGDAGLRVIQRLADEAKPRVPVESIRDLIAELDSDEFGKRDRATTRLEALGEAALPELRRALDRDPPLEVKQRIQWIVGQSAYRFEIVELKRVRRWIPVLELIGTEESKKQLNDLAKGPERLQSTIEAKEALNRLNGQGVLPNPDQGLTP